MCFDTRKRCKEKTRIANDNVFEEISTKSKRWTRRRKQKHLRVRHDERMLRLNVECQETLNSKEGSHIGSLTMKHRLRHGLRLLERFGKRALQPFMQKDHRGNFKYSAPLISRTLARELRNFYLTHEQ